MNKSKFLKKSLALLLAFMLVFAMIPLGALAADDDYYLPTDPVSVEPVDRTSGEVTGAAPAWNAEFKYSATLPFLRINYTNANDTVKVINKDGTETLVSTAIDAAGVQVKRDEDGNPFPLKFVILQQTTNKRSQVYTVTWTMPEASATGKATSAKLDGKYDGEIDETEKTITFTVPFGYAASANNALNYVISYEGCKDNTKTGAYTKTHVGTNMVNADGELVDNFTQIGNNEVDYTVIVKEDAGFTSFKIGDFETEFVVSTTGTDGVTPDGTTNNATCDIGCQTGIINVYIPADLDVDANGKLMLTPTFTVDPTNHTKVEIQNDITNNVTKTVGTLKNGEEFDFAHMFSTAFWNYTVYGAPIKITNTDEVDSTRLYILKFVRDVTDTTIDSFTADGVDGTVNGTNLTVEISPSTSLSSVNLEFVGPKQPTGGAAAPKIEVVNPVTANNGKNTTFGTDGKTVAQLALDCTKPVYLKVTSSDTNKQQIYTLTVKHAAQDTLDPRVLTAKLILNYNTANETTHIGTVDEAKQVITFSDIPYSTTDAELAATGVATTIYSFSKTPLTTLAQDPDGKKVTVTAAGTSQSKNYEVKFEKAAARTGKGISDFILTEATNIHEVGYNNNKTYDVKATVKANDESTFEVTVPAVNTTNTYFANFTLDGGAKMYSLNGVSDGKLTGKEVTVNFNADTGAQIGSAQFIVGQKYLIADEKLATAIAADGADVATFTQLKNNYPSNYTIYTMTEKTYAPSEVAILTDISADDGLITGSVDNSEAIGAKGKITLTIPYSYARGGKEFFLNFAVSDEAEFTIKNGSAYYPIYSGGKVTYNASTGKLDVSPAEWGNPTIANPKFKAVKDGDKYVLQVFLSTGNWETLETGAHTLKLYTRSEKNVVNATGDVKEYTIKEVKVADPIKDDKLSTVKANSTNATVDNSAKTVKVSLPFGTNLGQVKLDIVPSSKLAKVEILNAAGAAATFDPTATYDLSYARKIKVTADSGDYSTYTLTATLGTMFSDVPESAWYYQYVLDAANKGLVTGYEDGTFKPMNNITRGDFALIVTRMLGVDEDDLEYVTTPFSDVNDKTYNAKAISYCAENGFISGYEDGTFKPTKNISRQEAAKVLATALKLSGTTAEKFKDDATIASWASGYVYACKAAGIIDGDNYGNFNPKKMITRAETAKLMVEALNNK